MSECEIWMAPKHSWTRPSHYFSNGLSHPWLITMDRTFYADRLILTKSAGLCSSGGVFEELAAAGAQLISASPMMSMAIKLDHCINGCAFALEPAGLHDASFILWH